MGYTLTTWACYLIVLVVTLGVIWAVSTRDSKLPRGTDDDGGVDVKAKRKKDIGVERLEHPLEVVGWVDDAGTLHPYNDGNRYIYFASGYGWRPVYSFR